MHGKRNVLTDLLDCVLPRYCVVCGKRLLAPERDLCLGCLADIPYTYMWTERGQWVFSLFYYNDVSPYKRLALSVKYMGNSSLGVRLGRLLGSYAALAGNGLGGIDIVAPVPLHWTRKWKRGYNQSEMIAEGFVSGYGSVCGKYPLLLPSLFTRRRRTASQTYVNVTDKVSNVRNAFALGGDSAAVDALVKGNGRVRILIVDDTCTTGATLLSCSSALKPYGISVEVLFASVAKVRED